MGKDDDERFASLNAKFDDIKAIRERIITESIDINNTLKVQLSARKALSPEIMTKNLKSISSFLENFSKMMQNLSSKVGTLSTQIGKIRQSLEQIDAGVKALK
ncbi:MAG: hypothetical protein ACTSR8_05295 [Promethearchaeota archaeon]